MLFGDIGSLQEAIILELEKLYDFDIQKNDFIPNTLVVKLAEFTGIINNEIAVYITRKGKVVGVVVGDHCESSLPVIGKFKGQNLLSGIRCIHTHITENGSLSTEDINELLSCRLDGMVSIGTTNGKITKLMAAIPTIGNNFSIEKADLFGPFKFGEKNFSIVFKLIEEIDSCLRTNPIRYPVKSEEEKALLVCVNNSAGINDRGLLCSKSLCELEQITKSAGAQVIEKLIINVSSPDSEYYLTENKLPEISLMCELLKPDMVVFDNELSGKQIRNLERILNIKIIDRPALILDIFSRRAASRESKIQVELAQLKYIFPRLCESGLHLPAFEKGIGFRAPGQKKLEFNRKSIYTRLRTLAEDLDDIKKEFSGPKENRRRIPTAALIGFVNSGKSSLLNTMCNLNESTDDALLSSVDSAAKKVSLPNGEQIAVVDSVGFIKDLPSDLRDAFKSTLEEIKYADIIIHVVDSTVDEIYANLTDVNNILHDIGVAKKPTIVVFTKTDISSESKRYPFSRSIENYVEVSSKQNTGIDRLLYMITKMLFLKTFKATFFIPYHESWILSFLQQNSNVIKEEYEKKGTRISAHVTPHIFEQVKQFCINSDLKET
ncbi:MAG: GTPase HflX [Ignavibacteriales bacterium]